LNIGPSEVTMTTNPVGQGLDERRIWEYYQNDDVVGDSVFNARPRYAYVAARIQPGDRALNIGVGRGGLEALLVEKGVAVHALDPGERSIGRIREKYALGEAARVGFSQAIPFPDSHFDVVVMCEVLEHLSDDVIEASLAEVTRVLRPGGRFMGTVPADEDLLANLVMCPHCGETFHRWGHLQRFDRPKLEHTLGRRFKNVEISRHFFGDVRSLNWKGKLSLAAKRLLLAMGAKGEFESYFFSVVRG
jgi:SAM-dependent methyltransferase